ncbi:MAG: hypothetical protein DRQ37_00665 [Gammaproteobacteria bacterium]|nr:MAG: hypothetical protein DRQ37_00665 [Gammaproteobacteria bacterium]
MKLRKHSKKVAGQIASALRLDFNAEQRLDIINIIEKELINVVLEARNNCAKAALSTKTPHTDLAHEISRRIQRANEVLITNLKSMR